MILKVFLLTLLFSGVSAHAVTVGSKAFTESYILGELLAQKIEEGGFITPVRRKLGMGATGVLFEALRKKDIDLYVEYTGTIAEAILKKPELHSFDDIQNELRRLGLLMSAPLGFNNTYALAIPEATAEKLGIHRISDLSKFSGKFRAGFSHEFFARGDGFKALTQHYGLRFQAPVQSLEHSLSYEAIGSSAIDIMDVYSTDAKIDKFKLRILEDDRHFFPNYSAVVLTRIDFAKENPDIWEVVKSLEGSLNEASVRKLNAGPDLLGLSFKSVIEAHLGKVSTPSGSRLFNRIFPRTKEHLLLVGVSLFFSMLVGIPLGILATRQPKLGQGILLLSGTIQTIPSLALLCFFVPLLGIGVIPALVALCLYGLLPVVMNTFIGIRSIDSQSLEMAAALGLTHQQRLLRIELPLASRNILAGIRTSAVIGIGTATLAALIGAGGYGAPIVAGLAINDTATILLGAIPAAIMALIAHGIFELLAAWIVPRGL